MGEDHFSHKYSCPECGKGFNHKNNLNLHRKSHSDKQKLHNKCTLCNINFETEAQRSNHTMEQHPKKFETPVGQQNKKDIDPKAKQYNCMECDHQTTEKFKLPKHIELAHKASTSQLKI